MTYRRFSGRWAILALVVSLLVIAVSGVPIAHAVSIGNHDVTFVTVRYDYPNTGQSTWYYTVTSGSSPALSHLVFGLDLVCLNVVEDDNGLVAGTWGPTLDDLNQGDGSPVIADPDGSTGATGLKFDEGFADGEQRNYYFTVDGNYAPESITVTTKEGGNPNTGAGTDSGQVLGPSSTCATAEFDFGDLPESGVDDFNNTYVNTESNDGARHANGNLHLGTAWDSEDDGQPDDNAGGFQPQPPKSPSDGDDGDTDGDDEDGVFRTPSVPWSVGTDGGSVDVTVSGGEGCLSAWIDWYGDGDTGPPDADFDDTGEQILLNKAVSSAGTQPETITFDIPTGAPVNNGAFFARFRLYPLDPDGTCTTTKSPTGVASDGEVEDYFWTFGPTAVTLTHLGAASSAGFPAGLTVAALVFLAGTVAVGGVLVRRRQS